MMGAGRIETSRMIEGLRVLTKDDVAVTGPIVGTVVGTVVVGAVIDVDMTTVSVS